MPQANSPRHTTWFVSAGSGKLLHTAGDYRDVHTADLDGDGTLDLVSYRTDNADGFDQGLSARDRERRNRSAIHIDFMIGGNEVTVTGLGKDGSRTPVLVDGAWQL